jgi:photosystem II stability/assembly factor-like uncharacterized protein
VSLLGAWALLGASPALAADTPAHFADNTWTQLGALPERVSEPVFALAADPGNPAVVLLGTSSGTIYRSANAGSTWTPTGRGLGRGVVTIQFNPLKPGAVFAGARGGGLWRSADGGATWARLPGVPATSTVRSVGFAKSVTLAGTDGGLFATKDGTTWTPYLSFAPLSLSAVAVAAVNDPARFVAGADASRGDEVLPLYFTVDGGTTWANVKSLGSSTMVAAAAAGAAPPGADSRPVVVGTNAGAFVSTDGGVSWTQAGGLPATDFTSVAYLAGHTDRYYLASDGGGSTSGGLWATTDSGQTFHSLQPPVTGVTAFALTAEDVPSLYVATFRPIDHAVMLWGYRDAGGSPVAPLGGVPTPAAAPVAAAAPIVAGDSLSSILTGTEAPYIGLGAVSILILLTALGLQFRRGREGR